MSINRRAALLGALVFGLPSPAAFGQPRVTVLAAASLAGAMTKIISPSAKAFLDFLGGAQARAIFEQAGFRAL